MAAAEKGFEIQIAEDIHRIIIRFRGRWTPAIGQEYVTECRRAFSRLSDAENPPWTIFMDLTDFTLPPPDVQEWLERGFFKLRELDIRRQAVLLRGPIIHLPGLPSSSPGSLVSSYFQSEDEALEWLMEGM